MVLLDSIQSYANNSCVKQISLSYCISHNLALFENFPQKSFIKNSQIRGWLYNILSRRTCHAFKMLCNSSFFFEIICPFHFEKECKFVELFPGKYYTDRLVSFSTGMICELLLILLLTH